MFDFKRRFIMLGSGKRICLYWAEHTDDTNELKDENINYRVKDETAVDFKKTILRIKRIFDGPVTSRRDLSSTQFGWTHPKSSTRRRIGRPDVRLQLHIQVSIRAVYSHSTYVATLPKPVRIIRRALDLFLPVTASQYMLPLSVR